MTNKIFLIAEHDHHTIKPATLNLVAAAKQLGGSVCVLVMGNQCQAAAAQAAQISGVDAVMCADHAQYQHQVAENLAALVAKLGKDFSHILAAATTTGKNFLPRVAAVLDVQPLSDVTAIESADTFVRPIYAGNAFAKVHSSDAIKILTVRTTGFDPVAATGGSASIQTLTDLPAVSGAEFVSEELAKSDRPELTAARVVVSGGRGLQSGENFAMLAKLADKLGAAMGASRAAVDLGYVPNDMQVGQTGKIVAPDLYIAVGISGAIQHLAGMKESKVIVAINKDADAPIFQIADYGLVADLFEAVPQLTALL